jgi:hypothetical protein
MWKILILALAAGCAADTRFVRTDDTFTSLPAASAPRVYFDALPAAPYRAVGIISVVLSAPWWSSASCTSRAARAASWTCR